jgi:hypothetical protein
MEAWVDTRYCPDCKLLFVVACDCPPKPYRPPPRPEVSHVHR